MTLIKRSNRTFPTFFDDFVGRDWFLENDWETKTSVPAVNIVENDSAFLVEMVAPGMKKDDFKIELENNLLTISYEKEEENEEKDEKFTKREFNYQSFSRSFTIPELVNAEKINAAYKDGLLKLEIPKKEEAKHKPSRLISIS